MRLPLEPHTEDLNTSASSPFASTHTSWACVFGVTLRRVSEATPAGTRSSSEGLNATLPMCASSRSLASYSTSAEALVKVKGSFCSKVGNEPTSARFPVLGF